MNAIRYQEPGFERMDAIDRKLIILLEHDPRMTYKEIGNQLGVSTPTAQRRVENLFNSGRLRSVRYRIALEAVGGKMVIIFGQARVKMTPEVIDGLQDHGSINRFFHMAFNYIACWADIRKLEEIDEVMGFLMHRLDLLDPRYLVVENKATDGGTVRYRNDPTRSRVQGDSSSLTSTDLKIIHQLSIDGRQTISSIAKETGVSARSIKRHVDSLIKRNLIEQELDWHLSVGDDIWFTTYVRFKDPSLKDEFLKQMSKYDGHLITGGWDYSNAPDIITFDAVFHSQNEVYEFASSIAKMDGVVETNHSVIQMARILDTWVHKITRGEMPLPRSVPSKL